MAIQKINYNPSFGAKVNIFNRHKIFEDTTLIMRKAKEVLIKEPDLADGKQFAVIREGFYRLEDGYDEASLDNVSLAICGPNCKILTEKVDIYTRRVTLQSDAVEEDYGAIRNILDADNSIKSIAAKLRDNLAAKTKDAVEALREQAAELGFELVKK